jgi:hypothetical protein
MSAAVVKVVWFVLGTLVLAGVLVGYGMWQGGTLLKVPGITAPAKTPTPNPFAKPAGYEQSCAAAHPWGQQVSRPFICLDAPASGTRVPNGTPFTLRGYAGGSFENSVVVEWRVTRADGTTAAGAPQRMSLTYTAPDLGMPGAWQVNIGMNETGLPARVALTAYFTSPKDGARVAEVSTEVVLE